jgi:hypothetical protein
MPQLHTSTLPAAVVLNHGAGLYRVFTTMRLERASQVCYC